MQRISVKRILLTLVALATIAGIAFRLILWPAKQLGEGRTPKIDAASLIQGVGNWRLENDSGACPNVDELRDARQIDPGIVRDAWNSQYVIECAGDSITVRSLGPDRKANTADDLVMH
jgi:hypothetical protein